MLWCLSLGTISNPLNAINPTLIALRGSSMADTDIATFASEGNRDLHILFGSQSGNSEGLAEKWQKGSSTLWFESNCSRHGWF